MTDITLQKIGDMLKKGLEEAFKPVNRRLDKLDKEVSGLNQEVGSLNREVGGLSKEVSGLNKEIVDIHKELENINEKLDTHTQILDAHSTSLVNIENTLELYGDMYKINRDDIQNLQGKVSVIEERLDITTTPS